jgi:hypothetical protein
MKTAHRKASKAKRYQASPTSWCDVIVANREQDPENATDIMNKVRAAFEALKSGTTDCALFDRVAAVFNVGIVRAEAIDPLAEQVMVEAILAMRRCDDIYGRHRKYGFTGPDLMAVNDGLDLYEQILRMSTPRMMVEALEEAARRMIEQAQREGAPA